MGRSEGFYTSEGPFSPTERVQDGQLGFVGPSLVTHAKESSHGEEQNRFGGNLGSWFNLPSLDVFVFGNIGTELNLIGQKSLLFWRIRVFVGDITIITAEFAFQG